MIHEIVIDELVVVHRCKDSFGRALPDNLQARFRVTGLFLDTCLRQLAIPAAADPGLNDLDSQHHDGIDLFRGSNAYQFLLETAAGLNSAIPAETNVFGQFKRAWQACRATTGPEIFSRLEPIVARLYADVRGIRRSFLQGIGGTSYGTLVRKLLRPPANARVLFIGTGDLAQSMLPIFKSTELGIWNYREPLRQPAFPARCFLPGDAEQAARWADCAILTTPADDTNDRLWARLSSWYNIDRVAHLGIRDNRLGHWSNHPEFFCLDDVFRLRQSQSNVRSLHLKRARNACRELATRRAGESRFTSMDGQHPRRALG